MSVAFTPRDYSADSPPHDGAAVTPHDTNLLPFVTRALYIGVSGDVKVDMAGGGTALVFKSVPIGYLPGFFTHVYNTGTTATNLIAVW